MLGPAWAARTQTGGRACVTFSGNGRAGFSQCFSLPALVPFQYSGNLRSGREGLADTTRQPASGRGPKLRKWDRERQWEGGVQEYGKTKQEGRRGRGCRIKRPMQWQLIFFIIIKKQKAETVGEGEGFTADGTREGKLRGTAMKRKGEWVCEGKRRGERCRQGRGFDMGGKIRGFAGAAWTTDDLNGALNPAVTYPDFNPIQHL